VLFTNSNELAAAHRFDAGAGVVDDFSAEFESPLPGALHQKPEVE
jgi:hypothetical protein